MDPGAILDAFHKGEPLPDGVSFVESLGAIEASIPGVADPGTGDKLLVIRLNDEIDDLVEARVYLDGQLTFTATRASGSIVDRPAQGYSIATLTVWIPATAAFDLELQWDSEAGTTATEMVSIPAE